ncbi:MAG: DUF6427 family protein, partial [Bacteroidota bacterium]
MILLRFLKNSRTAGGAGLIILSLVIFIKSFIQSGGPEEVNGMVAYSGMPFYNLIFGSIHTTPFLNRIITLLLLWTISYMLIRISVRYVLLESRSFMPAIFFLLFSMALPETQQVSPALVGSIFYLFCFAILFDVHDKRPDTFSVFTAGIVLALGSMFYLKLIWFVPLIWISLATMRTVTWREIFYPVIAYFLLGLFLFTWYWAVLDDGAGFTTLIATNLSFEDSFEYRHYSVYIYYSYVTLIVLLASIYMIGRFRSRKNVIQNIFLVMFYMFVGGGFFFLFIARFNLSSLVYTGIPVSYILANYFHRKKNHWMHELVLWIV